MIKLVVAMDAQHAIGNSGEAVPAEWFKILPAGLQEALVRAYRTADLIAVGQRSFSDLVPVDKKGFLLTRSPDAKRPKTKLKVCDDFQEVIDKHISSGEELAVIGGATLFAAFLPHAAVLDLYVSKSPFDGNLKFTDWNDGSFDLVDEMERDEFILRRMFRI